MSSSQTTATVQEGKSHWNSPPFPAGFCDFWHECVALECLEIFIIGEQNFNSFVYQIRARQGMNSNKIPHCWNRPILTHLEKKKSLSGLQVFWYWCSLSLVPLFSEVFEIFVLYFSGRGIHWQNLVQITMVISFLFGVEGARVVVLAIFIVLKWSLLLIISQAFIWCWVMEVRACVGVLA